MCVSQCVEVTGCIYAPSPPGSAHTASVTIRIDGDVVPHKCQQHKSGHLQSIDGIESSYSHTPTLANMGANEKGALFDLHHTPRRSPHGRLHTTTIFELWCFRAVAGAILLVRIEKHIQPGKWWHATKVPEVFAVNVIHPRRKHTTVFKSMLVDCPFGRWVQHNGAQALAPLGRGRRGQSQTSDKLPILHTIHAGWFWGVV